MAAPAGSGGCDVADVVQVLSDLVAIPSINPMGRRSSGPEYLEGRVTDYLEAYFRRLKVDYRRTEVVAGRDNIVAEYRATASRRTLLWDVHQDTVPVEGMTIPPFEPRVLEGRLYGRGSCDVKASMAAMLAAFERLVVERPAGSASVYLACTVDEEYTHVGSSRLAEDGVAADLGIVAEPTRLDLVVAHKGAVRWKILTRGVACHSSAPERGVNAIYRMGEVLRVLQEHADELSRAEVDPWLGRPTLSVGRIEGGVSVNVVPDFCEIEIDRRLVRGEDPVEAPARLERILEAKLGSLEGVESTVPWVRMPTLTPGVPEEWLSLMEQVVLRETGRKPGRVGVPFGTDAGPLSEAGLPCVVLGPGDIAQAHTKDEWVELEQVRKAENVYYGIAQALE